jgi:RNA polymerase sigma-70 factor (ECF subfamily)
MDKKATLRCAIHGDINAFNDLFKEFEKPLKSYLYRLLTNREDVEDFYHNTFIKCFDNIKSFHGEPAQIKSWVFTIATRLSYNHLKREKIWATNAQDVCRDSLVNNLEYQKQFMERVVQSEHNLYEIREHIDFCFTCISKTLSIEQQVALLLKDVYHFKIREVADIMEKTLGQVKHHLLDARRTMTTIFEGRCSFINKNGICYQCTELQGIFNPKSNMHREMMKIKMIEDADNLSKNELFKLRQKIVDSVNPIDNSGMDLHDHLMQHMKKVNNL